MISIHNTLRSLVPLGVVLCLTVFLLGQTAFAQISLGNIGSGVEIRTTPEYPNAYEEVTVRVEAFGKNMTGASIAWKKNGVALADAKNARSFKTSTGALGTNTVIQVTIITGDGETITKSFTLTPSDVDIILEADTYIPEGYRGRALPSYGSKVRAVAIPHLYKNGTAIKPSDVVYTWDLNGTVLDGGEQYGRQVTEFQIPAFGRSVIGVKVSSRDGATVVRRAESITTVSPKIALYEETTLFGRSELSYIDFLSPKTEITIRAEPYYLTNALKDDGSIEHEWTLDGKKIENNGGDPFILTLEDTAGGGSATGNFSFRSLTQVLQSTSRDFNISFTGANFGTF